MNEENNHGAENVEQTEAPKKLSEDWLAVIIAFILILLAAIGILGENGLMINY